VNAKLLKEKLWRQIETNKVDESYLREEQEGLLYKTEFSALFSGILGNQTCTPQTCFVCLLHLANEKGERIG